MNPSRIDWVDYAKGVCIVLVVMMHSTLTYGYQAQAEGWLHHVVQFAQPFRMPDFFLISGLFLARTINAPLREYLDRKVLHFAYFYALWLAIQLSVTEFGMLVTDPGALALTYVFAFVQPINTLWFVHLLPVFYLATRVLRRAPAGLLLAAAALLQTVHAAGIVNTGWLVVDQFSSRYVFFVTGFLAAPWIFAFARWNAFHPRVSLVGLAGWAVVNWFLADANLHLLPLVSLATGLAGAAAVVAVSALLARVEWAGVLRHAGANSIVVYLTFVFPMGATIKVLAATGAVRWASLLVTIAAVTLPLLFHHVIRGTRLMFLYRRPVALRLRPRPEAPPAYGPETAVPGVT